jgi:hypothetical protein
MRTCTQLTQPSATIPDLYDLYHSVRAYESWTSCFLETIFCSFSKNLCQEATMGFEPMNDCFAGPCPRSARHKRISMPVRQRGSCK